MQLLKMTGEGPAQRTTFNGRRRAGKCKLKTLGSESQEMALGLSDPQFAHLSNGDNKSNYFRALSEGLVRQCPKNP